MSARFVPLVAAFCAIVPCFAPSARAQLPPWDIYEDRESFSVCDVVNVANANLVVLSVTGELVITNGPDRIIAGSFVDSDGFVFYLGSPFGVIDFAEDLEGFRTLWWTTLAGFVIEVDLLTGEPFVTDARPEDFVNVPCDACDFWDDPSVCDPLIFDLDVDGIDDRVDYCEDTPLDEQADIFGCSCSQLDDDLDVIDNCDDFCPETPLNAAVDIDGCACFEVDFDDDGIDECDDDCPNTPGDEQPDVGGCSCSQLDDDLDLVINCFDLCPGTPPNVFVDVDGCPCNFDSDGDSISDCVDECPNTPLDAAVDTSGCTVVVAPPVIICGSFSSLTLMMTLAGMTALGVASPRRRRAG